MKGDDLNCLSWNAAGRGILPSLASKAATNKVCPPSNALQYFGIYKILLHKIMLYNILGHAVLQILLYKIMLYNIWCNNALQTDALQEVWDELRVAGHF